ncbi:MAG TPA: hypothetical protein VH916_05365, partial [Dehalococcoidia bacterium]
MGFGGGSGPQRSGEPVGRPAGGGGGGRNRVVAVLIVSPDGVQIHSLLDVTKLGLAGVAVALGLLGVLTPPAPIGDRPSTPARLLGNDTGRSHRAEPTLRDGAVAHRAVVPCNGERCAWQGSVAA